MNSAQNAAKDTRHEHSGQRCLSSACYIDNQWKSSAGECKNMFPELEAIKRHFISRLAIRKEKVSKTTAVQTGLMSIWDRQTDRQDIHPREHSSSGPQQSASPLSLCKIK